MATNELERDVRSGEEMRPASLFEELYFRTLLPASTDDPLTLNEHPAYRFQGLNVNALNRACVEIVRRHDVLRTRYELRDGQLVALVSPPHEFELPITDLRGVLKGSSDSERLAELRTMLLAEASKLFDPGRGSPWKCRLFQIGEDDYVFQLVANQLVCDFMSRVIFERELGILYSAFAKSEPSPLPPLPMSYGQYVAWERDHYSGERLEVELAYLRQRLAGAKRTALPVRPDAKANLDRIRGERPFSSRRISIAPGFIPVDTWRALLKGLNRDADETAGTFYAGFAVLLLVLREVVPQEQLAVMTSYYSRTFDRRIAGLIGCLTTPMYLRFNPARAKTYRELVEMVEAEMREATAHPHVLYLGGASQDLFQVNFFIQPPRTYPVFEGVTATPLIAQELRSSPCELVLGVLPQEAHVVMGFGFLTELFEPDTVPKMMAACVELVKRFAANPDEPLTPTLLTSAPERVTFFEKMNAQIIAKSAKTQITEIEYRDALPVQEFLDRFASQSRPVVIRNATASWKARSWTMEGLKGVMGEQRVRVVRVPPRLEQAYIEMRFDEYVDRILALEDGEDSVYANGGGSGVPVPPSLQGSIDLPEYFPRTGYNQPKLWIGPAGAVTWTHCDNFDNFHVLLTGKKKFVLFPPHEHALLYAMDLLPPSGQLISPIDVANPSLTHFPQFAKAHSIETVLNPGDMLFIPSRWFHYVRSLEPTLALNFFVTNLIPMAADGGGRPVPLSAFLEYLEALCQRNRITEAELAQAKQALEPLEKALQAGTIAEDEYYAKRLGILSPVFVAAANIGMRRS